MVTIDATVGGASSNSYITVAEANAYFASRLPLAQPWSAAADPTAALAMATRVLDRMSIPHRTLRDVDGKQYHYTSPAWTGFPASDTQKLAWPRTGMFDALGRALPSTVIPSELKDAVAELAGQLVLADTTLDNPVLVGGITSVKAGSVAVSFKQMIEQHVLPDAVWILMPDSWFTDELVEGAIMAQFSVVSC